MISLQTVDLEGKIAKEFRVLKRGISGVYSELFQIFFLKNVRYHFFSEIPLQLTTITLSFASFC